MTMDYWGNGKRRIETQGEYEERTKSKSSPFDAVLLIFGVVALVWGCIATLEGMNGTRLSAKAIGVMFEVLGR